MEVEEWEKEDRESGSDLSHLGHRNGGGVGGLGQEDSGCKGHGGGVGGLDAPSKCHLLTCSLRLTGPLSHPPQLLRMFFRQQDEIRRLKEEIGRAHV